MEAGIIPYRGPDLARVIRGGHPDPTAIACRIEAGLEACLDGVRSSNLCQPDLPKLLRTDIQCPN